MLTRFAYAYAVLGAEESTLRKYWDSSMLLVNVIVKSHIKDDILLEIQMFLLDNHHS